MANLLPFLLFACFNLSIIPISLRSARVEGRRVRVFDDILGHVGLPLIFVPGAFAMPRLASYFVLGAGVVITVAAGARMAARHFRGPT